MSLIAMPKPDRHGHVIELDLQYVRRLPVPSGYRFLHQDIYSGNSLYCRDDRHGWARHGWIPRLQVWLHHAELRVARWIMRHLPVTHPINEMFQWRSLRMTRSH